MLLSYNLESYEYDVYALLTSFYPGVETKQCIEQQAVKSMDELHVHQNDDRSVSMLFYAGEYFSKDREYRFEPSSDDERITKWELKRFFYDSLADMSGRTLPWGGLTGVRPTKLIMGTAKEQDLDDEGVISYMYDNYRVSKEKAALGIKIARLEDSLLKPHRGRGYSLYIGIPFCPSTCLYCSFLSYAIGAYQKYVSEYLKCIRMELQAMRTIMDGEGPDTIYIGGGTPTALSADELGVLLDMIEELVPMENVREFTVEAGRPDSLSADKFAVMKAHSVSRISVNPQTFKDETLQLIGRIHSVAQLYDAFEQARAEGFDNINMDLILGLPGEDLADVEHTIRCVHELAPDSLTVHSLAIKRASRMKEWIAQHGAISGMDYERAMKIASDTAAALDMRPYYLYRQKNMAGALENTGFAREGKYGLYNIIIMEEVQSIYAIGAGTVSKKVYTDGSGRIDRCDTHKDLILYLSDIQAMIERKRRLFGNEE
ncbi:MAG: coproporphyrinogen dehydrogenase HemZ [Lachnospiraceae bacterium]|nr:coproporphyrinogen dehydrogenase HemZ [Lachnospiraceae bacterium]